MEIKELNGVLYYSGVGLPDNNVRPEVESVFFYINEETQKKYVWTINRISGVGNWVELGDTLKFIIFDELPEPSEEYVTTIALIQNPVSQESDDEYVEYACVYNNELRVWKWEKLNSNIRFWSDYYYDVDGNPILSKQEKSLTIGDANESGVNVNIVGDTLTFNGSIVGIIDDNNASTSSTYSSTKIESIIDGINQKITDDEEVVSAALNDLKIDIDRIESECEGSIKSITVNGTRVEADSNHNVELTAGTLTLTDADNNTLGSFTANSTSSIQIPEATSSEYGFVKVDNTLDSTSTNPVENRVITSAISSLVGIRCEVVSELPITGENGVIYLVPNDGSETNIYDEYLWIDSTSKFELIGTTEIDLSNYVTNDDLNDRLSYYLNDSDGYVISSSINELYDKKQDKLTAGNNITISNDGIISADVPTIGTLNTTNTTALTPKSGESLSGTIDLHKISKTGSYNDLSNKPTIPTVGDGSLHIKVDQSGSKTDVIGFNANQDNSDDITFVAGSNITLTPDAANKTITIAATSGIDITVPTNDATYPILLGNTNVAESDVTSIKKSVGLVVNPNKRSVEEGSGTTASGYASHAEGDVCVGTITATGNGSHAEGYVWEGTIAANGYGSHAEGYVIGNGKIEASSYGSHAEGRVCAGTITATGDGSHAEGYVCVGTIAASSYGSHAEGYVIGNGTIEASIYGSHAEGYANGGTIKASGIGSHAEGGHTTASGNYSHAEGYGTIALGDYSHASGCYTKAKISSQTVVGRYNADTTDALFVVGNGDNENSTSNAFYVKSDGSVYANGAYYAASDKRKKDIICDIDLEKAYSLLDTCQTVIYTWKDDESKKQQIGVLAQEIQQFFPEVVNEDENGMLSVDYSRLTVILMSVIKNNVKEMKSLEERIRLLEEKNK